MKKTSFLLIIFFFITFTGLSHDHNNDYIRFLEYIRSGEYENAYEILDSVSQNKFKDIADYYKLYLEIQLNLIDEAEKTFYERRWFNYAKHDDYLKYFKYILKNSSSDQKASLINFIRSHYPRRHRYSALLEYAYYLRNNNDTKELHNTLNIILGQRGHTWEKREALRLLAEIEPLSELNRSRIKERIEICLELRLLDNARAYIEYAEENHNISKYDINIMYADYYHRMEDYEKSLKHYLIAQRNLTDLREASRLHFRILLRYLYLGEFQEALLYFQDNYESLDDQNKANFLLIQIRILAQIDEFNSAIRSYNQLINNFSHFRNTSSIAQLTLASHLILCEEYTKALNILRRDLSRDQDYRQNKLLLLAIIHKEKNNINTSLNYLQEILNIHSNNYYSLFVYDYLKNFDPEDVKKNRILHNFYNGHIKGNSYDSIIKDYNLTGAQRNFLKIAYELEEIGIEDYLRNISELSSRNIQVKQDIELAIDLFYHRFFDESIHLLSNIRSNSSEINNRIFFARIFLISQYQEPFNALRQIEGHSIAKSRNIPNAVLPGYLKIALYPYSYLPFVLRYLDNSRISPLFILSIMREESRFQSNVVSWAGAIGLMQLLEETANRYMLGDVRTIVQRDTNINIGIQYIQDLYKEFNKLDYVAISYNAGEKRKRLLFRESDHPMRYFLLSNTVWFAETRHYLRKVWASYLYYQLIYDKLLRNYIRNLSINSIIPL